MRDTPPDASESPLASPLSPDQALLLDQQLCFALYSSSLQLTRLYKPHLDALGLTYPQYLVMLVLWEQDSLPELLTVNELGARLGLDSGTLTPLLKRMEVRGWIKRTRDVRDERRVKLQLSGAGLELKAQARTVPPSMRCLIGGADSDFLALRASLQALRERLSQA
jgi:MarR family transcriptional regulator, organic hydroperoxide resistance regulator